jgi:hypothetical protein
MIFSRIKKMREFSVYFVMTLAGNFEAGAFDRVYDPSAKTEGRG